MNFYKSNSFNLIKFFRVNCILIFVIRTLIYLIKLLITTLLILICLNKLQKRVDRLLVVINNNKKKFETKTS